jgi:hypothetical protein
MSSSLPLRLQAALPMINQPRPGYDPFDPAVREELLNWGLKQIEREIQPDPVFRPLDYLRKEAAEREWRKVVREQGVQHRQLVAGFHTTMAQEAFNDLLFAIQERRRRYAASWDKEQRIDEFKQTTEIATDQQIRIIQATGAVTQATQPPPPPDPMSLIDQIQAKIDAIDDNPDLAEEQKHRKTQALTASLQHLLGGVTKPGRG